MSIGFYKHPALGQARKYILDNKYVLQIKFDTRTTEQWSKRLIQFRQAYSQRNQLHFYLLPEDVYVDEERSGEFEQNSKPEMFRFVLYEHFIVTLKEQLHIRIANQQRYTIKELWYFLYALISAVQEYSKIQEVHQASQQLEINPDTILINEYGYIKLVGYFSTPFGLKPRSSYKAIEGNHGNASSKFDACSSMLVAKLMSSLILLKDMDEFFQWKSKIFDHNRLLAELSQFSEQLGIIVNIIKLMLKQNSKQRILLSEIKILLQPYEEKILNLQDFIFDKTVSRQNFMKFLQA